MRPRSAWKDQYKDLDSSKFHNAFKDIFRSNPFLRKLQCYQEVSLEDIFPNYPYRNHRYDWYIYDLNLVIELHGNQHYKQINFGNVSFEKAENDFKKMQKRDSIKKQWALENGIKYLEVPYSEYLKSNQTELVKLILEAAYD